VLGGGQVDERDGGVGQPVGVADAGDADDARGGGRQGDEVDGVADGDAVFGGGSGVDHDLPGAVRCPPLPERVGGERRCGPAGQHGGALWDDGLPVDLEQALAADDRASLGDTGGGGDAVGQVGWQRVAGHLHAHAGIEGGRVADAEVDAGGGGAELLVEQSVRGVGEHQSAGDECDAERHGQPGQRQPRAVGERVAEGEPEHGGHAPIRGAGASRPAM
jgi:hypothetical protein